MKRILAVSILLGMAGPALAECPIGSIERALNAPLEGLKKTERSVSDVQSTEGGVWRIYKKKDGTLQSIVRIDGGESGMSERRLSVLDPKAYGIAVTRVEYLRHAFIEEGGPNGTARRVTEYFYFCGGKLHLPPADFATQDLDAYAKAGTEAQKAMLRDKDIAADVKLLAKPD
ncbi:hypothetical protein [Aestuariivirga sp.]|uniref:hypothetical protein n=1 Tax=Aestuariivirga sp. TaxID=2650926 RepID=UPI003BAC3EC4